MNVRIIANDGNDASGDGDGATAGARPTAATAATAATAGGQARVLAAPGADPPFAYRDAPVSIGDRLRRLLTSGGEKSPLYPRLLRLKNVHPNGWQRALLVEGMALVGALVALADRATAWAPLALPVGAAVVVKFHDVLAGLLPARPDRRPRRGAHAADDDDA